MTNIPDYYQPGSRLTVQLGETRLSATVVQAFTPFTTSQVLLVHTNSLPLLPASFVVLKVYDPRFCEARIRGKGVTGQPWTYTAEAIAAKNRTAQWDPDYEPGVWPDEHDAVGWEEWHYQNAELQFRSEVAAYDRLKSLQGGAIPRCFATGTLPLAQRAIAPRVLFLEYLSDAKTLEEVDPRVVGLPLAQSLVAAAGAFGPLGVVHTDLNPGNILFVPGGRPTRAVVIDFANSGVREEESDEEWGACVYENADVWWMTKRLHRFLGVDLSLLEPNT
ncbi:hypothetical protein FPV67DRAFT_1485947 [Lyophyllum atratum]|nr:hypothetical protein FPV67DRAFT_1485947 [Lyophyllum atratum]